MIKKILLILGVILLGLGIVAAVQPPDYLISRELQVKASPEVLFSYINDSEKMNTWMPWAETDPAVKMVYSGPQAGIGSKAAWTSTGQMGKGESTIIESVPKQSVKTQITYFEPMSMSQISDLTLQAGADGTLVRWAVSGKNGFISRLFCLFMNMDKMVGPQFEKGLLNLKALAEGGVPAPT